VPASTASALARAAFAGSPACTPCTPLVNLRVPPTVSAYALMAGIVRNPAPKSCVRNAPGSTMSTHTPKGFTSAARHSDSPSSACFAAQYAPNPGPVVRPPVLVTCTIVPARRARMCGRSARVSATARSVA